MPRVTRALLLLLTILSLLLFLATATLWARAYTGCDYFGCSKQISANPLHIDSTILELVCTKTRFCLSSTEQTLYYPGDMSPEKMKPRWFHYRVDSPYPSSEPPPATSLLNHLGFAAWSRGFMSSFSHQKHHTWTIPAALPPLVFAIAPTIWLRRFLCRRHRFAEGCCHACGYDLAGNVSGVCPECGTAVTQPQR